MLRCFLNSPMKGTIMLINNKGNIVTAPKNFADGEDRVDFLAPLREVLEPRCHKRADGFDIEARAKLK